MRMMHVDSEVYADLLIVYKTLPARALAATTIAGSEHSQGWGWAPYTIRHPGLIRQNPLGP